MAVINYRNAISEGIARAMRKDDRVVFLGEDVGAAGGAFKSTPGLLEEFGPERVWDTPISEQAILGAAIGASLRGFRPIAEIMFADFLATCWDQVVNHAAKLRYMSDGRMSCPIVIRVHGGAGLGFGAQHSQIFDGALMGVPGLRVVHPSTPRELVGLMQSAVACPDPVLVIEHKNLFNVKEEVDPGDFAIPLGQARFVARGGDVTVVTVGASVHVAAEAAALLAQDDVQVDLIDLRTLNPLDMESVLASVNRTGRLLLVEEGPGVASWSSEVAARVASDGFWSLEAPVQRVTSPDTPTPFASNLEAAWIPSASQVADAVRAML